MYIVHSCFSYFKKLIILIRGLFEKEVLNVSYN